MKKIIEGKLYNTDTAREIASYEAGGYGRSDFNWVCETIYCKKTGEYFLWGQGGANTRYAESTGQNSWSSGERIMPLSYEEAKAWMERHATADDYEAEFGGVSEDDSTVQIGVSMPASDAEKLKRLAKERGLPVGRLIAALVDGASK